jgi:predicted RNA-binding protein with PIN domain
MRGYQSEVTAYTRGRGKLFYTPMGYEPCHNCDEVIAMIGYDSERDLNDPTGSVFCAHGTSFIVDWDRVEDFMHIESGWQPSKPEEPADTKEPMILQKDSYEPPARPKPVFSGSLQEDKELEEIFIRTFGPIKQKLPYSRNGLGYEKHAENGQSRAIRHNDYKKKEPVLRYLLVDGYNIIFSWDELNDLATVNIDAARNKLMDILCNYQGFTKCILILVFDAYKVKGGVGEIIDYHNIHVVYTKEAETADEYIEKVTHEIAREHRVTVATSDALEQVIILGQGAVRLSANDLKEEILRIREQIRRDYLDRQPTGRSFLKDQMDDSIMDILEGKGEKTVEKQIED